VLGADGITIFDAVEKQLGLKLEMRKVPKPVIVVDHVNRKPTDNPPGVAQGLPPPFPRYEVDIQPASSRARGAPQPGTLVNFRNVTLKTLIMRAWGMSGPDPPMAGGPEWLESEHFDVVARASESLPPSFFLDDDSSKALLSDLLKEHFELATHNEVRPVTVFALLKLKGRTKLRKADRSNRSVCQPAAEVSRDRALTISFVCRNTTMAQLADRLQALGWTYLLDRWFVDATGLKGSWDFTLGYTGTRGAYGTPECPPASSGCVTVFDALEKQLGLKLELQKRPMPVLVIDYVERKPADL
jgi:uncharacterized protein (TIGR03435 family)